MDSKYLFPNPRNASKEGLLAYGGDLNANRLLAAYESGIFPWYSSGEPILWWSPNPRAVLFMDDFHISKSLQKRVDSKKYSFSINRRFLEVITMCAKVKRADSQGTWINEEMIEAYYNLYKLGYGYSFEVCFDGELVGGLYGVIIKRVFFGESMFHTMRDCSKLAMYHLVLFAKESDFAFIDCQMPTAHLLSLGAKSISRDSYLDLLKDALE